MMRPAEVVHRAAGYLERHDVPSPVPTAETLLAAVLGTTRVGLYTREEGLSSAQAKTFGRALCRRCTGTPLQYLTGEEGFRHLTLTVRPGVFIPRPETEIVVERGLSALRGVAAPVVVDVGTGTGAIALAVEGGATGRARAGDRPVPRGGGASRGRTRRASASRSRSCTATCSRRSPGICAAGSTS